MEKFYIICFLYRRIFKSCAFLCSVGEGLASGYWGVAPLRYQLPPFMKSVLY